MNIWGLPLRIDIVNYLIPMWHVCSNKFHSSFLVIFWLLFVWVAWCGFSLICISIYCLRNHLFHIILTMVLPVGLNSWNYQQTLLIYGILFLISYHMLYLVRIVLDISITGKIIPNGHCLWTIHSYICDRIFLIILTLALVLIFPSLANIFIWDSHCLPRLLHGS